MPASYVHVHHAYVEVNLTVFGMLAYNKFNSNLQQ